MLTEKPKRQFKVWQIVLFSCLTVLSVGVITFSLWWHECPSPPAGLFPPSATEPTQDVYIVRHDFHTGLAWQQPPNAKMGPETWRDAPFLEIGWGDRGFYYAEDKSLGSMFRAFFLSTPSVLHVVGFKDAPPIYFPDLEVWKLKLSSASFNILLDYVLTTFSTDAHSKRLPPLPGKGQYGVSNFYDAVPDYGFWRTCNTWLAEGLRRSGIAVCPRRSLLPEDVIKQIKTVAQQVGMAASK